MKIDEALTTNLKFWQDQQTSVQRQIAVQVADVERLQGVLAEANTQVVLYTKAAQVLASLEAQPTTTDASGIQVPISKSGSV